MFLPCRDVMQPAPREDADGKESEDFSSDFDDEEGDELGSLQGFSDEDTKTRFTNYSMSSSIIRRNKGLTLVDDKFEQVRWLLVQVFNPKFLLNSFNLVGILRLLETQCSHI